MFLLRNTAFRLLVESLYCSKSNRLSVLVIIIIIIIIITSPAEAVAKYYDEYVCVCLVCVSVCPR